MNVFLGSLQTATDWTDGTEFKALQAYNPLVAAEILKRYGFHTSLRGWYFTQEIWMNWVAYNQTNYNAGGYYGTTQLANWVSEMNALDPTKLTTAAVVVKEAGDGAMPGLTPSDLQGWMTSFLQATNLSIIMP